MWQFKKRKRKRASTVTKHYLAHKEAARSRITERLVYWNQYYNFSYNRVAIRNQRLCWGSCSSQRNLNFNYKLTLLPECLLDYVVVHELCHLQEMHHGASFWALVEQHMPDYRERRQLLRQFERIGASVVALEKATASHQCMHCTLPAQG